MGRFNNLKLIDAVGTGNVIIYILGYSTAYGLNGAINTFVSQAVGAKKYAICGVNRWTARIVFIIVFAIMLIPNLLSGKFLVYFGIDADVAEITHRYVMSQVPAMFIIGFLTIDINFLVCFGKSDVAMYCQLFQPLVHICFCYLFIVYMNLQTIGGGIAMAVSNLFTYGLMHLVLKRSLPEAHEAFDIEWHDKRNFDEIWDYLKLGIPSMLMLVLEWTAASVMTVIAGRIGLVDQTCAVLYANIQTCVDSIPTGI